MDSIYPHVFDVFAAHKWSVVRYDASITGQKVEGKITNEIKIHFSSSLFELTLDQTLRKVLPTGQKVKSRRQKTSPTELVGVLTQMISGTSVSSASASG